MDGRNICIKVPLKKAWTFLAITCSRNPTLVFLFVTKPRIKKKTTSMEFSPQIMLFWTATAFPFNSRPSSFAAWAFLRRWRCCFLPSTPMKLCPEFWWAFCLSGGWKSRHPLPKKLCLDNALVKGQCWLICSLKNGYFQGESGHRYPFNSHEDMRQKSVQTRLF